MDLFNDLPEPKNNLYSDSTDNELNLNKKRALNDESEHFIGTLTGNKKLNSHSENVKYSLTNKISLEFKATCVEKQGERDSMQDKHIIIDDFKKHLTYSIPELENLSYYAVFDGHAGSRAAIHCAENLHLILADKFSKAFTTKNDLSQFEKDMKRYFIEAFKQCDEDFLKIATKNKPAWKDGTTVTVILILNYTLYSANLGDSKAIICKTIENIPRSESSQNEKTDYIIELTKEHSACLYEERQRIQKAGGQVRDGRVLGALEVSRSIGDGPFKAYGVISLPDMRKCQLNSSYKFIILACDGLWKIFNNEEAIKLVKDKLNKGIEGNNYEACCEILAKEAVKKFSADNVTVMIISINEKSI